MNYIKRDMEKTIIELSKEYSCILLTGPRQVGKSTLLSHISPSRETVTLDDLQERILAKTDPEMFLKMHKPPVLIDEVQYAPELFSYIKMAIDAGAEAGSYFLAGSQSFELMRLSQESLAGRIAILNLSSLSSNELYSKREIRPFTISLKDLSLRSESIASLDPDEVYERIWKGGMPSLLSGKDSNRDVFYSSYLQTYIFRDLREEITVKSEGQFADFVRSLACRIGQVLNIHSVAKDVGISDDTAKRWLSVLRKSEIIFFLNPYSNNLLKRSIKTPKVYFFDTGLVAYLTRHQDSRILESSSINGAILENYAISEIRKSYINCGKEPYMYYYRDKDQREIDLILEHDGFLHPIEIKKTMNPSLSMTDAFNVLKKANAKTGEGAIICLKGKLSALDSKTLIIPVWYI